MSISNRVKSQEIVETVLDELYGRKGFDSWIDDIGDDIKAEMTEELYQKAEKILAKYKPVSLEKRVTVLESFLRGVVHAAGPTNSMKDAARKILNNGQ